MSKKILDQYGRYQVVSERLTDGSKVYGVEFPSDDGAMVVIACSDLRGAQTIANNLHVFAIDVSLRDLPEAA